jgi:RND family efflux transporter MFP subunit
MKKHLLSILFLCSFSVIHAEPSSMYKTVGTAYPQHRAMLMAQVSGKVQNVLVEVGDQVVKGASLVILDPLFFNIDLRQKQAAVQEAKVHLADARLNYERMKKLWEKPSGEVPAIPQKRYDDAKVHYQEAYVALQDAEEDLKRADANLAEATIHAPFDGVIAKKFVDPGETISAMTTKLLEIEDIATIYIEFSLPQAALSVIKVGSPLYIDCEELHIKALPAACDVIYPHLDEATRTVRCRATVDCKEQLIPPGTLVNVSILQEQEPASEKPAENSSQPPQKESAP